MTEVILALLALLIVIFGLLGFLAWYIKESNDQREMLIRALMAEDLHEFDTKAETPVPAKEEKVTDEVPIEELDNETFDKFIKSQNLEETEE